MPNARERCWRATASQRSGKERVGNTNRFGTRPVSNAVSPSCFNDSAVEDDDALFPELSAVKCTIDAKPEEIDSMIAKEMSSLSIQDREKVYFGIHGVAGTVEESPELIRDSLHQLQIELTTNLVDCPAFLAAKEMNPSYVQDENFQLMFLRADLFDVKKAANRIGLHFTFKLDLFGKDMLTKPITQDCLDEEALKVLYSGLMRSLEERDSAGRAIVLNFLAGTDTSIKAKLQAMFYTGMLIVSDVETQCKGCVGISFTVGQNVSWLGLSLHRLEWNKMAAQLTLAIPIRFEAMHLCHDSLATRVLLAMFKLSGNKGLRLRMREHFGTRTECLFSLQTFGIPTHDFPMTEHGKILTDHRNEILEKQRKLEQLCEKQAQTQVRVGVPSRYDVLFGRGKAYYRHVGNLRLRAIVEERLPAYEATNVTGKKRIRDEVVSAVQESGSRFLRDDGTGWVEVSNAIAGQKVAHAFRTLRRLKLEEASLDTKRVAAQEVTADSHPIKRGRQD